MKTKEQIYVHIKNEETRKQAVEVLNRHNQIISPENKGLADYNENPYLKFDKDDKYWVTSDYKRNLTEISVEKLDEILSQETKSYTHNKYLEVYQAFGDKENIFVRSDQFPEWKKIILTHSILQEAEEITNGSRAEDYGNVRDNFTKIANIWTEIIGAKVTPEQVGLCMMGLKIAREVNTHKRDNLVDLAGYANCLDKMYNEANQ